MEVDFIIVGQGLAGTLLSYQLLRLNKSILVIDDPQNNSATSVAAGLINPVVFRRMTKSWGVDLAYAHMETTYLALENLLGEKFYYPSSLLKILNEQTAISWEEKVEANQLKIYAESKPDKNYLHPHVLSPFGVGKIIKSGRVDLPKMKLAFSDYLQQNQQIKYEEFNYMDLVINANDVTYKDINAQKIIFCEGPAVSQNPYFNKLKFKHSKGEILDLEIHNIQLNEIISNDIFVIPMRHDQYKVGATYGWDDLSVKTTSEARDELLLKLSRTIDAHVKIITQQAGIRPTMHDRKPVAGFHPSYPSIGIFNGLGSKGALLAPWISLLMAEYMCGLSDYLPYDISIERYFK